MDAFGRHRNRFCCTPTRRRSCPGRWRAIRQPRNLDHPLTGLRERPTVDALEQREPVTGATLRADETPMTSVVVIETEPILAAAYGARPMSVTQRRLRDSESR